MKTQAWMKGLFWKLCEIVDQIKLTQDRIQWLDYVTRVMNFRSNERWENHWLSKRQLRFFFVKTLLHGVNSSLTEELSRLKLLHLINHVKFSKQIILYEKFWEGISKSTYRNVVSLYIYKKKNAWLFHLLFVLDILTHFCTNFDQIWHNGSGSPWCEIRRLETCSLCPSVILCLRLLFAGRMYVQLCSLTVQLRVYFTQNYIYCLLVAQIPSRSFWLL